MPLGLNKPADDPSKAWPSIMVGMFVAFGGILYGYDTGTIGGIQTMPYWQRTFFPDLNNADTPISKLRTDSGRISLIVSILSIGTFCGALLAGQLADITGRKWGIILSAGIPFNVGVILQAISTGQSTFLAGRFFAGLGVGLVSVQVPMYQSETLPKWIRGLVVGSYQLCITIGLLIASLVNNATKDDPDASSYRIPICIQFAWSGILVIGMFLLPETPRFLIKKNKHDKAVKSLCFLRRLGPEHPAIEAELAEFQANYNFEMSLGKASYMECFKGTVGKRLATGILLQSLQQLVGINFIFYYGTSYFASRNAPGVPAPFTLSVITNVVNTCSTFPGLWAVDRFGRRPVLLVGAIGMGVSQYIVAAAGDATSIENASSNRAQFSFICVYIFFFASTWGPSAWVVTGEMFPLKVRAKCLSMTTAANWFFNWLLAYVTPYLVGSGSGDANLKSNIFWIWGGFCWIAVIFVYTLIYETKNLTLEEVSELYETTSKAWKSRAFRPQISWREAEADGFDGRRRSSVLEIQQMQGARRASKGSAYHEPGTTSDTFEPKVTKETEAT